MAERDRATTSSVDGLTSMFQSIQQVLRSPVELSEEEEDVFNDVIAHREAASWDRHDLRIAGQLAKASVRINRLFQEIDDEGVTTLTQRGTPVANPKVIMLQTLISTQLNLNKTLGLSASQKGLSGSAQDKRNAADRAARGVLEKASEDDLI